MSVRGISVVAEVEPQVSPEERSVSPLPTAEITCSKFTRDPGSILDYSINWRDANNPLLETGEKITASSWSGGGLTVVSSTWSGSQTTVFLSGGTVGVDYVVENTVTTSLGRTYCRGFRALCRNT